MPDESHTRTIEQIDKNGYFSQGFIRRKCLSLIVRTKTGTAMSDDIVYK